MTAITQLYGKNWFTWYDSASGGVQGVIDTCKQTGSSGVLVKAADGVDPWAQIRQDGPALKAAGLVVGAWDYAYPNLNTHDQAAALIAALPDADYLVVDAEKEYEIPGGAAAAAALGLAFRAAAPNALIGYTSFGAPQDHQNFPYAAFSAWTDFCIPQVYFADFGTEPQIALADAVNGLSHLHKRIFPAGQAYAPATPEEIALFSEACVGKWIESVFWWDIQLATPALKQAVADSSIYTPAKVANPQTKPVAAQPSGYTMGYNDAIDAAIKTLGGLRK